MPINQVSKISVKLNNLSSVLVFFLYSSTNSINTQFEWQSAIKAVTFYAREAIHNTVLYLPDRDEKVLQNEELYQFSGSQIIMHNRVT